jgi:hypothetical protein
MLTLEHKETQIILVGDPIIMVDQDVDLFKKHSHWR